MNLNHVHLHVGSVPRAAAFYNEHFGMRELVWHGDMVFMRDEAGMDLALAPATQHEPFPSWFHIGFRLDSARDVEALYQKMRAAGVSIKEPFTVAGDLAFFRCADPDDYLLEIYFEPDPVRVLEARIASEPTINRITPDRTEILSRWRQDR